MRRQPFLRPIVRAFHIWMICAFGLIAVDTDAIAGKTRVAVASNYTSAAKAIGVLFEKETVHSVIFSFGATGQLYTQITQGAPYDVFLAADQARPARAVENGYAVRGSRFTYAEGRLVLFTRDASRKIGKSTLTEGKLLRIAIANPVTAPYGVAAVSVMQALGQIAGRTGGSHWLVPTDLHSAIAQDAVLLRHGAQNVAAHAFLAFLKGNDARRVSEMFGYSTRP